MCAMSYCHIHSMGDNSQVAWPSHSLLSSTGFDSDGNVSVSFKIVHKSK